MEHCGARTRSGAPCRNPPLKGKRRCRKHGGPSSGPLIPDRPTGNLRALKHGLYSERLLPGEDELLPYLIDQLGELEYEATFARVLLLRTLTAMVSQPRSVELYAIADRFLGRIVRIEEARQGLGMEEVERLRQVLLEKIEMLEDQLSACAQISNNR